MKINSKHDFKQNDYKQQSMFEDVDKTKSITKEEDFMNLYNKNTKLFEKGKQALEKGLIDEAYEYWVEIDPYEFDYQAWWQVYLLGWELFQANIDCLYIVELAFGYAHDLAKFVAPEKAEEILKIHLKNLKNMNKEGL